MAGERWERALNEAANRCEAVLFLVSKAWLASGWCLKEFNLAHKLNKRLLGLLIEDLPVDDLPVNLTSTWQIVRLAAGRDHVMLGAVVPITHEEVYVTFSAEGLQRLKHGLEEAGLDPKYFAWPPANEPDRPPYRGLHPLEAEDAGIFFGRDGPIVEALDELRGLRASTSPRLLVILGASGAGKSSFLRAGLFPRLARDDRNFLPLPVIRPERAAISGETGLLAALEAAFAAAKISIARADLRMVIQAGAIKLKPLLQALSDKATPMAVDAGIKSKPPTLILSIDQGEELFLAEAQAEAQPFLALLRDLLNDDAPAIIAVFTIRSDNYERLQLAPELEGANQVMLSLPPMPKGSYADVVKGPARRLEGTARALAIEDVLVDALLADIEAGGAKDALPLLAFTLERLYDEYQAGGVLKLAHYEVLGRVRGSIEAAVEHALQTADADPAIPPDRAARLALLRRGLIPWLAGIDPDTKKPRRRVARLSEIPEEARSLIECLVNARLLSTDRDRESGAITVEPTHEALLRQWALLNGWLEEDSGALAALDGVRRATVEWNANARATPWLAHRSGRLEEAERQSARAAFANFLNTDERAYLAACRAAENKETTRRRRHGQIIMYGSVVAALILLIVAGIALWNSSEAEKQRGIAAAQTANAEAKAAESEKRLAEAAEAETRFRASQAQHELDTSHPVEALLLALTALPDQSQAETVRKARGSVHEIFAAYNSAFGRLVEGHILIGHSSGVRYAAFSPDGKRIVTTSNDGTARIWDSQTGNQVGEPLVGHVASVTGAAFSPDGRRIVTAADEGTARVWDAVTNMQISTTVKSRWIISDAKFSSDGKIFVAASHNIARLWNVETGTPVSDEVTIDDDHIVAVSFYLDEKKIITVSNHGKVQILDVKAKREVAEVIAGRDEEITKAAFSFDGGKLVTISQDNRLVQIWDLIKKAKIREWNASSDEAFNGAAFSPDGRRIVTTSGQAARIWDIETGQQIGETLYGHEKSVSFASFSPDGERVVTASDDRTARIWTIETGKTASQLRCGPSERTPCASVARRGRTVVINTGISSDFRRIIVPLVANTMQIWDLQTQKSSSQLFQGENEIVTSIAISPDGHRAVSFADDGTVSLWDVETTKRVATPVQINSGLVLNSALSPDGRHIASSGTDNTAQIWDIETGEEVGAPLTGHDQLINSITFSPDGKFIVTASNDYTARIWDAITGLQIGQPLKHEQAVNRAAFSPDGKHVVTAADDHTARIWDTETGKQIGPSLVGKGDYVLSAEYSPDGKRIVTADSNATLIWDASTGAQIGEAMEGWARSASFSSDGNRIVIVTDNNVRIWNSEGGSEIGKSLEVESSSARFSFDGRNVVTISPRYVARITDARTGEHIGRPLTGHLSQIKLARFSPDGNRVVTADRNEARIWDVKTAQPIGEPLEYAGSPIVVAFSRDGKRVLTADDHNPPIIWDIETGKQFTNEKWPHQKSIVALSPDGRRIVTARYASVAQIWDVETGDHIGQDLMGHSRPLRNAKFSSDGKLIVTASDDGTARVWDSATGKQIGQALEGHANTVYSAVFSSDGRRIVTASADGTVRVWDAGNYRQIGQPFKSLQKQIYDAMFSSDGSHILTISDDGAIRSLASIEGSEVTSILPRCLTAEQNEQFHLPDATTVWCAESRKYPYDVLSRLIAATNDIIYSISPTIDEGKLARDLPNLTKLIDLAKNDARNNYSLRDAFFWRGRALNILGRYVEAVRDFGQAATLGKSEAVPWVWWTTMRESAQLRDSGSPRESLLLAITNYTNLKRILTAEGNADDFRIGLTYVTYPLGVLAGNLSHHTNAMTDCDRLASNHYDPLRQSSGVKFEEIDATKAKGACDKALALDPSQARFYFQRGRATSKAGNAKVEAGDQKGADQLYREALVDFKEAAQRNYPFAFNNIGRAYETGQGVEKDPKRAAALHVETLNRVFACCAAPVMSELLAAKDIDRGDARRVALLILDWAGTLGDPVAQHDLAEDFLAGTFNPPDGRAAQAEAYRHFRLAEKLFGEHGNVEDAQAAAHKAQELAAKLAPTTITALDAEIAGWTKEPFTADPPWLAVAFAKR